MKNKDSIATLVLRLAIITLCAGLVLGVVYTVTKEPIAQQDEKKATEARQVVLPGAEEFEKLDLAAYAPDAEAYGEILEVYQALAGGQPQGHTFAIETKGYSSGLNLTVGIDAQGNVTGVQIGNNSETPGLGAKAAEPVFTGQYSGAGPFQVVKAAPSKDGDVLAITGATITSKAVTNAVNMALSFYNDYLKGA